MSEWADWNEMRDYAAWRSAREADIVAGVPRGTDSLNEYVVRCNREVKKVLDKGR